MSLVEMCARAFFAADYRERQGLRTRWVMDRPSYDRLRAETVTEGQERDRAQAHALAWLDTADTPPLRCPVCPGGPFADMAMLTDHVIAMADPANREPGPGDVLLGIRIEVREGAGEPHLETPGMTEWKR